MFATVPYLTEGTQTCGQISIGQRRKEHARRSTREYTVDLYHIIMLASARTFTAQATPIYCCFPRLPHVHAISLSNLITQRTALVNLIEGLEVFTIVLKFSGAESVP